MSPNFSIRGVIVKKRIHIIINERLGFIILTRGRNHIIIAE